MRLCVSVRVFDEDEVTRAPGGARPRASASGRDERQAQPAKVLVEGEAGHALEQRCHDDERDGVAERDAVIAAMPAEDLLRLDANIRAVIHEMESRLDVIEEANGGHRTVAVAEERDGLADH